MTVLYVLDTDHITLLQRQHPVILSRVRTLPPEVVAVTVVSAMEQVRGRLAQIHRAKTGLELVNAFARLQETLAFYHAIPVLPYDATAAAHFARLRHSLQRRPGTQDLRIAAIALSHNATVVTRNQRDFEGIPHLQLADWSMPMS